MGLEGNVRSVTRDFSDKAKMKLCFDRGPSQGGGVAGVGCGGGVVCRVEGGGRLKLIPWEVIFLTAAGEKKRRE